MSLLIKGSLFISILFVAHLWIKRVMDTEENNQKMKESLETINNSYTEVQGKISQARKYRHDIPKHLHMMEEVVSDNSDRKYCEDELLNIIACMKAEKCLEQNIDLKIKLSLIEKDILTKLPIEKVDFNALIQNLLDNAIEACCRIPESSERKPADGRDAGKRIHRSLGRTKTKSPCSGRSGSYETAGTYDDDAYRCYGNCDDSGVSFLLWRNLRKKEGNC